MASRGHNDIFGQNSSRLVICTLFLMKFLEKYQFLLLFCVWGAQSISDLQRWNVDFSNTIDAVIDFAGKFNQIDT